jgi:DNA-binding transcriptional LysR family regulator
MFNAYRYLLEVERCGSIRVAASNLHVSPSAISRHIKLAELDFGILLFERTTRGVAPTSAGQMYLRHARSVVQDGERARLEIDDLKGLRRGHLRIATIDGIVSGPLSDALSSFKKLHPGITFHLQSTSAGMVMKLLGSGDADIGITYNATPDADVSVAMRIADPLLLVVVPGHPLAKKAAVDFKEALDFPIALPEPTFGIRKHVDAFCQFRRIAITPDLETNSIEALRGFARSGAGVTMLHYLSIKRDLELGLVVAIPFRNKVLHRSWVEICVQSGRPLPIAAEHFIKQLKLAFSVQRHPAAQA